VGKSQGSENEGCRRNETPEFRYVFVHDTDTQDAKELYRQQILLHSLQKDISF
jgi:hypothetical protein